MTINNALYNKEMTMEVAFPANNVQSNYSNQ